MVNNIKPDIQEVLMHTDEKQRQSQISHGKEVCILSGMQTWLYCNI